MQKSISFKIGDFLGQPVYHIINVYNSVNDMPENIVIREPKNHRPMRTPLTVLIEGKAELNQIIKDTLKVFLPALKEFEGEKICKVDNSLLKAAESLKTLLPKNKKGFPICYITFQYGKMVLNFKISKNGGSYDVTPSTAWTEYFERTIEVGKVEYQTLTSIEECKNIVQMYDLDREINIEEQKKKEELEKLKAEISPEVRNHFYIS